MKNKHPLPKATKLFRRFVFGAAVFRTLNPGAIANAMGSESTDPIRIITHSNTSFFKISATIEALKGVIPEHFVIVGLLFIFLLVFFIIRYQAHRNQSVMPDSEPALEINGRLAEQFLLLAPTYTFIREMTDETSRFVVASENFRELIDQPRADLVGKRIQDVYSDPQHVKKILTEDLSVTREEKVVKSTFTLHGRDFISTKYPIKVDGKTFVAGFVVDVTQRIKAEQNTNKAISHYLTLARQNGIITWELDSDGRLIAISDELTDITGYRVEEVVGQPFFQAIHATNHRAFTESMRTSLRRGESFYNIVHAIKNKEGNTIWFSTSRHPLFNEDGSLKGAWGTSQNTTDRILSEQNREEDEKRYQVLTENMKDIVWYLDADTLEYLYLSPSLHRVRGFLPDELLGRRIGESQLPRQAKTFENLIVSMAKDFRAGQITTETFFVTELREIRKDKSLITTEVVAHFWKNSVTGKLEVHGSTRNIDQRKRIENELRESRRKYAALLGRLPGMAYRCRLDKDRTMEFVSSGSEEVTGYTFEALTNNAKVSYLNLIDPNLRPKIETKWDQAIKGHTRFEDEYQIKAKTGEWRWVWERSEVVYASDNTPLAIEGFISDITARREAEAASGRLLSAIEQSGESIIITDANANIIYVNPSGCEVSGYTKEEIHGKNPRIFKSGHQSATFYEKMWASLLAGKTWIGKFENRRKDGTLYTESATISPAFNKFGQVVSYIAVKRDISAQINAEKEKNELQTQLLQSQKLESVGRLAGGIAHEFNNMLQTILGYAEMALVQASENSALCDDLLEIKRAAIRSTNLTRQLLSFARKQPLALKEMNINTSLDGMLNIIHRMIGENITLEWIPAPALDTIKFDNGQFEQIVFNLCINARDAMPQTGTIRIMTKNINFTENNPTRPKSLEPGRYVELKIKDTGKGIADEILPRIFEPFFTTKELGEGTGLGLSVVYGIITQSGGAVSVITKLGEGSEFHIYLPSFNKHVEIEPERLAPNKPPSQKSVGILVVDDEEMILKPTQQLLVSLGHRVFAANSASEAIGLMTHHASKIDLILTDVMMPRMSGPEMIKELHKLKPNVKYIFMSGHTSNLIEQQGLRQDSINFIEKPFSRLQLNKIVSQVLQTELKNHH